MNGVIAPAHGDLAHYAALDRRLLEAVRGINVLSAVAWPASKERKFLDALARGAEKLPRIEYARRDFSAQRAELDAIAAQADASHPLGDYLQRAARSWHVAARMLESLGTDAVTTASIELYGKPDDPLPGSTQTNLDAGRYFLSIAGKLGDGLAADTDEDEDIPAPVLREEVQREVDAFFGTGVVKVELDPELTAKAAAGASRIRLRSSTTFNEYDRSQLLAHEAFVHTLTALNGRAQPVLKSLSRTSPRATATQEGLAVFAELMSGSIDIARLKRISLRILAIEMALQGADFIGVFRYFREHGQTQTDSFTSAQRVFRGVPLTGGAAFTKDNVYLAGLLTVHTFFRWAFKRRRLDLLHNLFAGKFALDDVIRLAPCFADGSLGAPKYLPPWVRSAHGLAGKLAFSLFANRIRMGRIGQWDPV
ncbi:MAG TPA: flavohemoglobin expression-modulating QEGLA motif protein [Rhodanobacteraceae bacterium]|nr:flavohemoglobin expression-modulating QEGLA motif protein [Rhodanobacteraceae bacterium]